MGIFGGIGSFGKSGSFTFGNLGARDGNFAASAGSPGKSKNALKSIPIEGKSKFGIETEKSKRGGNAIDHATFSAAAIFSYVST